jgi:MiaB-like tRNA modifying enzyme
MNSADMEILMGILASEGNQIVDNLKDAEVAVVLTCTVKTPTERKVLKRLMTIEKSKTPLIVAGCMPKAQEGLIENKLPNATLLGPDNLLDIQDAVHSTLKGTKKVYLNSTPNDKTCLPRIRKNKTIHIQPISTGCLGNCSYCIVKRARGEIHSFSSEGILRDVKTSTKSWCKEIWITAEDTAAYNDKGTDLTGLLSKIAGIDGDFRIRIGMMTPNQAQPLREDLAKIVNHRKVYNFLHLPLQSGSNEILEKMRRKYTANSFLDLVKEFREKIPRLTLSTDIICGFPGETEEQFMKSIKIIKEIQPEVLNISRFWPRPGTEAANLPQQVHGRITKERSRKLTAEWRNVALKKSKEWVGWKGKVLVNEHGKEGSMIGRNYA